MQRFLVNKQCISHDNVILKGEVVHQIKDVLRLRSGDSVIVFDNDGLEYTVILEKLERHQISGTVCTSRKTAEPDIKITLYQALLKSDKFEFVLQKCTEIGVSAFVPAVCERCVARKPAAHKMQRWEKVIKEATEQSGRGMTPVLETPLSFNDACNSVEGLSLIASSDPDSMQLTRLLRLKPFQDNHSSINIFIGPEGGFTKDELSIAQRCDIRKITLGPRVLRSETAGLVAATAIFYEYGELDRTCTDIQL